MQVAPANLVALFFAVIGFGLLVAAFLGDPPPLLRLGFGISFLVLALLTSGVQLLLRNAASDAEGA